MLRFGASKPPTDDGSDQHIDELRGTITELRKRVKELEDGESETVSSSRTPSVDETEELSHLRKELARVNDEKATMELDFMNQLASSSGELQGELNQLREKLATSEAEYADLQEKAKIAETMKSNCYALDKQLQEFRACHISEMKRVKEEHQAQMKEVQSKLIELENEKKSLLEEVSEVRIQLADEGQAASMTKSELEQQSSKNEALAEALRMDKEAKEETIEKLQQELGEMNDNIIEMEGQKAVLLDEIMRLQKQVERESKKTSEFKSQVEDLLAKVNEGEKETKEKEAMEEWAKAAEAKAESLESDLQDVTENLKSEVARLEEALAETNTELKDKIEEVALLTEDLADEKHRSETIASELKQQIDEKAEELERAHDALNDEEGKTGTITAELKGIIEQKQEEIDRLRERLNGEISKTDALSTEIEEVKNKLDDALKAAAEAEAELSNICAQREAYEKRTSQNIMEQVTEVDSLRAQNNALYEQVQNLNERLENESDAAAKLMLELSALRSASNRNGAVSRSVGRSLEKTPPTSPKPSWKKQRAPPADYSPSRTPVKHMAAYFEKETMSRRGSSSPTPSSSSFVSNSQDVQELDMKLEQERERVRVLQEKVKHDSEIVSELRAEIAALTVANKSNVGGTNWREFEKRSSDDQKEIERLKVQLEVLQQELDAETRLVEQLKTELKEIKSDGDSAASFEQRAGASRKSHPWTSSNKDRRHDNEVSALKESLTTAQIANADMERDFLNKVKSLEDCIEVMEKEMETELKAREDEIDALQKKLDWQTEEISRLEMERAQLCSNMDGLSMTTKEEMDQLQAKLEDKTSENVALSKQIREMRESLDEDKGDRSEEVEYWKQKVKDIEERERKSTRARMNHVRSLDEMKAENEKLRASVQNLTVERKKLQDRVKSSNFHSSSASDDRSQEMIDKLRAKNFQLKKEVDRLSRRGSTRPSGSGSRPGGSGTAVEI